jgi:hypothetical protein
VARIEPTIVGEYVWENDKVPVAERKILISVPVKSL